MKLKFISTLGTAALALTCAACSGTNTATTNTTVNKSNTAVVTNSNAPATNTAATSAANTASAASTSSPAMAGDVLKIDEAGIAMTVPKGFKFSKDGEDTIVQTDDEGVDIRFTVPKDNDYNKVVNAAATEIDDYLNDVKIEDKGSKVDVNGMEGTSMSGTAKDSEGELVMWDLTIIKAPKKPVLVNTYAEKSSIEKHAADVTAFLKSVEKQ
jgi:hypothetical protein